MGVAVDGLCPPSAGLQRNQWCTFSRPAAAAFSLCAAALFEPLPSLKQKGLGHPNRHRLI